MQALENEFQQVRDMPTDNKAMAILKAENAALQKEIAAMQARS